MKRVTIACALAMMLSFADSFAQDSKSAQMARQEMAKASKAALKNKATKTARKEARRLAKEGWTVAPGALPLDKQLDKSYTLQYQYDTDGFPEFITAEAMSVGGNYDAAKMQALELAKQNLAGQIQTEVTALVENTVANNQMEQSAAASVTRSVMASKNLISQNIGRVMPVVEIYRVVGGNNREVLVRLAYSQTLAKAATKRAVREDLERRGDELHGKLDKLLNW